MQPASQTQDSQPDFQDYTWFETPDPRNSLCTRAFDGRVYLGVRGYDKRRGGPGYISVAVDPAELQRLAAHLQELAEAST